MHPATKLHKDILKLTKTRHRLKNNLQREIKMSDTESGDKTEIENVKHPKPGIPSLSGNAGDAESVQVGDVIYSRDEAIEDLIVLSESFPERRITRDFYRRHANIPETAWTGLFGTFAEFIRSAGLELSRYQNKIRLRAAQHASNDHLRTVNEERKNYGNLYDRDKKSRFKTMIACSDLHDIECDPFYLRVLTETIKNVEPNVVCLDGDIFDLAEFGKYSKDPREWDTVGRIRKALDMIGKIREAAPDAQIDLIEGNHEARLIKHLLENSGAITALLSDFHDFDLRKLLGLDQYEVNYVANADLCTFTDAQLRKEMVKNHKVYWNSVLAHHFPHGRNMGLPGFNGHHHMHHVYSEHNTKQGSYEWHQMGCGHKREACYCDGSKWNNGFLIVNVDTMTESVVFDYVSVGSTFSVAGGTWYYRQEDEFYPALSKELNFRTRGSW